MLLIRRQFVSDKKKTHFINNSRHLSISKEPRTEAHSSGLSNFLTIVRQVLLLMHLMKTSLSFQLENKNVANNNSFNYFSQQQNVSKFIILLRHL